MRTNHPSWTEPGYEVIHDGGRAALHAPVLDLGQPAHDRLARSRRWMAIARFRRSVYLRGEDRDIVCLCGHSLDSGPLNVRCALPEVVDWRHLDCGAEPTGQFDGESLRFGDRIRLRLGRARIWKPASVDGLCHGASARLRAVLAAAAVRAPGAGLGTVFRMPRSRPATDHSLASDGVLVAAGPALAALGRWLACAGIGQTVRALPPPREAIEIVGLGPGLTPSGDDYLGGLMIGLRAINRADLAIGLARLVLPVARGTTATISSAHLACAAEGYGGAALHRTLAAIAGSEPLDTGPCLDGVARMGATSGWDALAGAMLPLCIHLGVRPPAPGSGY